MWEKLCAGGAAEATAFGESLGGKNGQAFRVPAAAIAEVARHPRLRRSSAISRFAVVAGLNALRDAGIELNEASAARTALIFAISNGGVIYTRRFFHEIVKSGASAASPLLFPETVFNAPASHLAAILGLTGASYTLVGDGAVGILALKMAEDLMADRELDRCLVVGAEEADWLLCDAYRQWRLLRAAPPIEPFARPPKGMILSEGAGAVVLARKGDARARAHSSRAGILPDSANSSGNSMPSLVRLHGEAATDLLIASANGTFIDAAERAVAARHFAAAAVYTRETGAGRKCGGGRALAVDLRRAGTAHSDSCRHCQAHPRVLA